VKWLGLGAGEEGELKKLEQNEFFIKIEGFVQSAFCGILGGIVAKRCVLE